jgi:glycosyltransferase involved in cell wall biosynthesis
MFDAAITRRALGGAQRIYALNGVEVAHLEAVGAEPGDIALLPNGVELPPLPGSASGPEAGPEGLFLGRLHQRKRPQAFAEAAIAIAGRHPSARFAIVGPDEGERAAVEQAIRSAPQEIRARVTVEGSLPPEETLARLSRSDYFVLPSVDEPFGMAAVEAMSVGKPVIVTQSCGLADEVQAYAAGEVVGSTRRELQAAMERLVVDGPRRRMLGANGRRLVEDRFTIDRIVAQLVADYAESIDLVRGR